MTLISNLSQKGQVVIPKKIRDYLGLVPGQRVKFELRSNKVFIKPQPSVDEVFAFVKRKQNTQVSKKVLKKTVREQVEKKFIKNK